MPLTFEQFKQLRDKGLSNQQIISFEAGNVPTTQTDVSRGTLDIQTPTTSRTTTQAVSDTPDKELGILGTVAEGVVSPLAATVSALMSVGASAYKGVKATTQLARGDKQAALQTAIEAGEPIEIAGTIFTPPKSTKEAIGIGIQLGTAAIGGPLAKGLPALLGVPAKSLLGKIVSFGVTSGLFGGAKAAEEGKSAGEIVEETVKSAAVGAAIPIGGAAIKGVGRFLGGVMKRFAGAITGKGTQAIEAIIKNPQDALIGLKGDSVDLLKKNSKVIRNTVQQLNKQAQDDYANALANLPDFEGKLTSQGMKAHLTKELRKFNVIVDPKKATLDFTRSTLRASDEKVLKEVLGVVNAWDDLTPAGIETLAVKIGNHIKPGDQSNALNSIISGLKKNVRNYIGTRIPEAKVMVQAYAEAQQFLDDISSAMNVKGAFGSPKGIRETSNKLTSLFSANKDLVTPLVETIEQVSGQGIIGVEAGRQLAQAPSRASVSIGDFVKNLTQTVIPPSFIGRLSALSGLTKQKSQAIITGLNKIAPQARTLFLNALTELMSNQSTNQKTK